MLLRSLAIIRFDRYRLFADDGKEYSRLISKFSRDLQSRSLDQRRQLAQARHRHAECWSRDAEARLHAARVIPYRSGHTTDVQLVLLHVTRISVLADAKQLRLEFLKTPHRVRSQPFQFEFAAEPAPARPAGMYASMTLPTAVQYSGTDAPMRE